MFTLKLSKIKSKLKTAQQFWQNHRKKIVTLSLLLVVFGVLAPNLSNIAHAAPVTTGDDAGTDLLNALLPVMRALRKLLWPFLILIGNLLQGDLIFGGPMESTLLKVWVNVRNIVNILFALLLVGIALYNVVGGFKQDFHLKEVMPKFIIGLILVNFTFLGIKAALDGINVIATGIFALPRAIGYELNREIIEDRFCRALYTNDNKVYAPPAGKDGLCTAAGAGEKAHLKSSVDSNGKPIDNGMDNINNYFDNINARNVAVVLAINFQNIDLINDVSSGLSKGQEASIKNLVVNVILSVLLYVVYGSAFIALFIVLLVRVIVLWVLVVLSPLVAFMWVLPGELKSMMSGGEDIKQQFVKHAIVPIPVAISLAIGTILLDALKNTKFPDWSLNQTTSGVQFFTSGISSFQELIAAVACVAFIWTAVFDAMKDTKAAGITNGIKDWVGGMGKSIAKLPLMTPMFPLDAGKPRASILDVYLAAKNVPHLLTQRENKSANDAFPQAFSVADTALAKLASAKDFPAFMAEVKKLDPATFRSPEAQKQMAAYFAKNPLDKARAKMPDGFFKTLAEGKVDATQMGTFGDRIGYKYEEPTSGAAAMDDAARLKKVLTGKGKNEAEVNAMVNAFNNRAQVTDKKDKEQLDKLKSALEKGTDDQVDTEFKNSQGILRRLSEKSKQDSAHASDISDKVAPILNKIDGLSAKNPADKGEALKAIEKELSDINLDPKNEADRAQMETVQKYLRAANVTANDVKNSPKLEACLTTPPKPPEPPKAAGGPVTPTPGTPTDLGGGVTITTGAKK